MSWTQTCIWFPWCITYVRGSHRQRTSRDGESSPRAVQALATVQARDSTLRKLTHISERAETKLMTSRLCQMMINGGIPKISFTTFSISMKPCVINMLCCISENEQWSCYFVPWFSSWSGGRRGAQTQLSTFALGWAGAAELQWHCTCIIPATGPGPAAEEEPGVNEPSSNTKHRTQSQDSQLAVSRA